MIIIDMMMRTKTDCIIRKNGDMTSGFNCYDFLIESLIKPTWDMSSFCCTKKSIFHGMILKAYLVIKGNPLVSPYQNFKKSALLELNLS